MTNQQPRALSSGGPQAKALDGSDAPQFVEELLAGPRPESSGTMAQSDILSWAGSSGTLADGRVVHASFSCLIRPMPGDHVLVWITDDSNWVLAVLHRRSQNVPAVIQVQGAAALEASRIAVSAKAIHLSAGEMVTSARTTHLVSDTTTETSRLRVTQVETDVRRTGNADHTVEGTLLQRMGTWMSTTVRDARLTARTFLFN